MTTGARQLVVQEAAVTMWSTAGSYCDCGWYRRGAGDRPGRAGERARGGWVVTVVAMRWVCTARLRCGACLVGGAG